jgi:hypothetical protein
MSSLRPPCFVCETEGGLHDASEPGGLTPGSRPTGWIDPAATRLLPGFRWTVLRRHGKRPLALLGRILMRGNNRCAGLPSWSEISVLETAAGRFAASVCHAAPGAAGPTWCDSFLCDTPDAVRDLCLGHDPLVAVPSFVVPGKIAPNLPPEFCIADLSGSENATCVEALAAQRFSGAWAGLLVAMFGPHAANRPTA